MTERDREILAFAAEHRIILAAHVQMLLDVSAGVASRRLAGLRGRGLLKQAQVLHQQPSWYWITRPGLALVGSDLPPPRVHLGCYQHDIGLAWVWLAASRRAFGRAERIVSEREMRSRDGASTATGGGGVTRTEGTDGDGSPFGVPVGFVGPRGRVGLHYPDLLLIGRTGERVAIELELTAKGPRRLETILAAYGADRRVRAVLYLTEKPGIGREVQSAARRLGVSDLVHVQPVAWPSGSERARSPRGAASRSPVERRQALAR
jgi:hypothetical protein